MERLATLCNTPLRVIVEESYRARRFTYEARWEYETLS